MTTVLDLVNKQPNFGFGGMHSQSRAIFHDLHNQSDLHQSQSTMAKKHMRYMTRQFRKQIRMINEGLNTQVTSQIRLQETES